MVPSPQLPFRPQAAGEERDLSRDTKEQLLFELLQLFQEERKLAERRHNEILKKLYSQPDGAKEIHEASKSASLFASQSNSDGGIQTNSNLEMLMSRQVSPLSPTWELASEKKEPTQESTLQATLNSLPRLKNRSLQISNKGFTYSEESKHSIKLFSRASEIVKHRTFELVFAAVILVNALVICFEVQYRGLEVGFDVQFGGITRKADQVWPAAEQIFAMFDWVFGLILSFEVLMRIVGFRCKYACDIWNYLDLTCVAAFLLDKVASTALGLHRQTIQLIRLFRLLRLVKLIRTLEGLDHLYLLTTAIKGMNWILAWTVLLLSVLLMTSALFLTQVLHSFYFDGDAPAEALQEEMETRRKMYEYFGTFTRCLFSMFELTLANWPPVARLLSEEFSEWFMLVCLVHKLTVGLAVVGVMNGVILQETFKVAATDDLIMVRQKKRAASVLQTKMRTLFTALDSNGDGDLDFNEFEIIAGHPEVRHWLASLDIETDDLRSLFILVDVDNNGKISADELIHRIPRLQGPARSLDVLALREALKTGRFADTSNHLTDLL